MVGEHVPRQVSRRIAVGVLLGTSIVIAIANLPSTPGDPHVERWRPGDIVFLNGTSFRSRIVRLLQGYSTDYSHVGLVVIDTGVPFVVHADPSKGAVVKQRWDTIITPGQISGGALYRLRRADQATLDLACLLARRYACEALPFDQDFDLKTGDRLFCTELVWRAYRAAGVDLCPDAETEHPHLLPADLLSAELEELLRF